MAEQIKDLKREFPGMKGFSPTNLKYMRNWYLFYVKKNSSQFEGKIETHANRPQLVDDLQKNDFSSVFPSFPRSAWECTLDALRPSI
jgi:hypothetical protein